MRVLPSLLAAGILSGFAAAACAQGVGQTNGWYLGASLGESILPKQTLSTPDSTFGGKIKESNLLGPALQGVAGYGLGSWRIEEELGWTQNGVSHLYNVPFANGTQRGSITNYSAMTNVLYDIPTGWQYFPILTIGAGLGAVDVKANSIHSETGVPFSNDNSWVGAAQLIVGEQLPLTDQLSLAIDGRFRQTDKASWQESTGFANPAHNATFYEHSYALNFGFIYKFNAPPQPMMAAASPPPPPPPAPAPKPMTAAAPPPPPPPATPRAYMVFFDFDKSNISGDAEKVLAMAAANAKKLGATQITLTGHTDTVGSDKYNMALSLRRANAVKAVLVKQGIPANEIAVVGKGKADLLVPTPDGVREPKNRRVEIVLP